MRLREFLLEQGGQAAGKLELGNTSLKEAKRYAEGLLEGTGKTLDELLPDFDKNFLKAKTMAALGTEVRKEMPVINDDDVRLLQQRLKQGKIDIHPPFADATPQKNPFPEGLSGDKADEFLQKGLQDSNKKDDIVSVSKTKEKVGKLKPIQKQIYLDKSLERTLTTGDVQGTKNFLANQTFFIVSKDNFIIDGHHRYMSGVLIDPEIRVTCIKIDLPISMLLPLTKAYGDAIGNKRNL